MILQAALDEFLTKRTTKGADNIHWLIWLLENPKSLVHLHGACKLKDHDYIHIILDRGQTIEDEAFVIGFTMGNDDRTQIWEKRLFKFISHWLYPKNDRFTKDHLEIYDQGFAYGRSKLHIYQRIGEFDWSSIDKYLSLDDVKNRFSLANLPTDMHS